MKTEEAYTELSVQLARIEAKIDKILSELEYEQVVEYQEIAIPRKSKQSPDYLQKEFLEKAAQDVMVSLQKKIDKQKCIFDSIPLEDRNKPMGICCPCSKCRATSLASAFNNGLGLEDAFNNPNAPKSIVDAVDNPLPVFNAHITETV
jgi:hypothetical protein